MGAPVIFQCNACRALGSAAEFVVAEDGTRAGLVCGLCRFTSWLPAAGHFSEQASPPPPAVTVAQPALPQPSPTLLATTTTTTTNTAPVPPTLALVPVAATTALATSFSAEQLEKIQARLAGLVPPNESQLTLAESFERLLTSTWATEALHKSLLKAAAISGELAFVGARYRAVLDVVRDEPRAKAAQQELLTLAMATMQQSKDLGAVGDGGGDKRGTLVAAVLIGAILLIGGAFVMKLMFDRTVIQTEQPN